jgi:hypothetical protein
MVTNIDFTSPEASEKKSFSGKTALIISGVLLVFVSLALAGLLFMKNRYVSQQKEIEAEISLEQDKIKGSEFTDVLDFQDRLNLLDKTISNHSYWDALLLQLGSYVIPEVRFEKFSGEASSSGGSKINITGAAGNLDSLSRELILLKSFPGLDSLEFKGASDNPGGGGVSFDVSLKVNKSVFQKK